MTARRPESGPSGTKSHRQTLTEQKPELSTITALIPRTRRARRTPPTILDLVLQTLEDGKAEDIVTIDLAGKTTIADHMVIASGRSTRQVLALTEHLEEVLSRRIRISIEGKTQGDWVLIDAGDVIVHLFRPEIRSYYNLEKMWGSSFARQRSRSPVAGTPRSVSAFSPSAGCAAARSRNCRLSTPRRIVPPPAIVEVEERRSLPPVPTESPRGRIDPRRITGRRPFRRPRRARRPMVEPRAGRADRRLARPGFARARLRNRRRRWPPLDGSRPRRGDPLARVDDLAPSAGPRACCSNSSIALSKFSPVTLITGVKQRWERYLLAVGFAYRDRLALIEASRDEFPPPSAGAVHSRWMGRAAESRR